MTNYKVVLKDGGQLYSCYTVGPFREIYVPGVQRTPFVGKTYIFRDYDSAVRFLQGAQGNLEVWECEAVGVEEPQSVLPMNVVNNGRDAMIEAVKAFWSLRPWNSFQGGDPSRVKFEFQSYHAQGMLALPMLRPPEGTLFADKVTLLRKLL